MGLDAGIVGSNPTGDMDVYVHVYVYSVCVVLCRQRSCDELITRPRIPTGLSYIPFAETRESS
jgi:hypothetical protein